MGWIVKTTTGVTAWAPLGKITADKALAERLAASKNAAAEKLGITTRYEAVEK